MLFVIDIIIDADAVFVDVIVNDAVVVIDVVMWWLLFFL